MFLKNKNLYDYPVIITTLGLIIIYHFFIFDLLNGVYIQFQALKFLNPLIIYTLINHRNLPFIISALMINYLIFYIDYGI